MSEETQTEIANSPDGVVLPNAKAGGIGWLVNYAIYDGSIDLKEFVDLLWRGSENYDEGMETFQPGNIDRDESNGLFRAEYRRFVPLPRHGGSAFSQAVKALETKAQRVVYDEPDGPLSNNKEKMRLKKDGKYGYLVQWNIIPLRKNREYALERSRRGYIDGQSGIQVFSETLYRIKTNFPDAGFTRHWMQEYVAHVWEGAAAPSTHELRNTVIVEPMLAESLPADGRFMRQAQERLRDAFVVSSTCIDDDKLRKLVRGMITQRMGGILPHASSGGVYFVLDRGQTRLSNLNRLQEVVAMFAASANQIRTAMWADEEIPWWDADRTASEGETPVGANYTSGMRTLTYGSSAKELEDIRKMYVSSLQNAQSKYYQLVHEMLRKGEIDEELLMSRKEQALAALRKAQNEMGAETVEAATAQYTEVVTGLTDRLSSMWSANDRETQEEQKRVKARIDDLLSLRLL